MRNVPQEATTTLSSKIIAYVCGLGHSQADIARMLDVSEGFISLVKSRERSLTLDHIELLAGCIRMPIGAMLIGVTKPSKEREKAMSGEKKAFYRDTEALLLQSDRVTAAMKASPIKRSGRGAAGAMSRGTASRAATPSVKKATTKSRGKRAA